MFRRVLGPALIASAIIVSACSTGGGGAAPASGDAQPSAAGGSSDETVGVAVFQFSNTYLTLVRNAIEAQAAEKGIGVDVTDGQNSQPTQNEQIDLFISKAYPAMADQPGRPRARQRHPRQGQGRGHPGRVLQQGAHARGPRRVGQGLLRRRQGRGVRAPSRARSSSTTGRRIPKPTRTATATSST